MSGISDHVQACFLNACRLDVAVRKPGNVSVVSPGHRMHADLFIASAQAAALPLCEPGARVGARIEAAMAATWASVGCNTNLGILLLCAPLAAAAERPGALGDAVALRDAVQAVLEDLDRDDARAAYRAIALAHPGGLGDATEQDVRDEPSLDLRAAMALAADRDNIARQYANGFAELFDIALPPLLNRGFPLMASADTDAVDASIVGLVQRLYIELLSRLPDSHIVRKHGEAVAHIVMRAAQAWRGRESFDRDPDFAAWDAQLKADGINPGTSADFTVAALFAAGLLEVRRTAA